MLARVVRNEEKSNKQLMLTPNQQISKRGQKGWGDDSCSFITAIFGIEQSGTTFRPLIDSIWV